jgi:ubiquinone/menaquinone biosynthesis C-methylase UbiE
MTSPGASPFVDYDAVADRYAVARALDADGRGRWGHAALGCLPHRPRAVADVGSGTGIFARAWTEWTNAQVIGVEPSPAMLRAARSMPVERVRFVRAVAEALPLADRSVDVAWVSTAFHHFADQALAAREMARVLRADGRVLDQVIPSSLTLVAFAAGARVRARG